MCGEYATPDPNLRTALDRAGQFLGLAVLVSIALAGLAIALSAQRYAVRHYDNCAIMRCFGASPDTVCQAVYHPVVYHGLDLQRNWLRTGVPGTERPGRF